MASKSETGHDKNIANFEVLISACTSYGANYNPSKATLKTSALQTLHTKSKTDSQNLKVAKTALSNAENARQLTFKPLKKLATRIINALQATDATKQTIEDAKTINHKIQGTRASKSKKKAGEPVPGADITLEQEPKTISVSQQSYDSLINHFAKLIQLLSTESNYSPNETELKLTTLNTLLTNLKTVNTSVINATATYNNALITRNDTLYKAVTGLVDIALDVKKYIKSVFGATSQQYKQISKVAFRKYKV